MGEMTMAQHSVLIVDDDLKLAALLETYFKKEGFVTYLAYDGLECLSAVQEKKPDIIVLDLMLPGLDGWAVCRQIRKEQDTPIIMLTARDEESDRLIGLEIGADDYVTKPFSPKEVVARARAIFRRVYPNRGVSPKVQAGNLIIDLLRHEVICKGMPVELTPTEFKILELLAANTGQVFSRLQIVERTQGYLFEGYARTVDAHVKNLRRKLAVHSPAAQYIQTVYGVGYKFAGDAYES